MADDGGGELAAMKLKLKEMEEEAALFKQMQEKAVAEVQPTECSMDEKAEIDARSAYIGNLEASTTPEELQKHFQACGVINRITILCDKLTGLPKGFAYVEFAEAEHVQNAITALNESLLKGRSLRVTAKRTNLPSFMRRGGRGGRASRFRGGPGQRGGAIFKRGGSYRGKF